jgi:uncharacterized protein YodC (DUF2158 family)
MRRFRTKATTPGVEPGDTVAFQSGGAEMTVMDADPETGDVRCWWKNSDGLSSHEFGDNPVWPHYSAEP